MQTRRTVRKFGDSFEENSNDDGLFRAPTSLMVQSDVARFFNDENAMPSCLNESSLAELPPQTSTNECILINDNESTRLDDNSIRSDIAFRTPKVLSSAANQPSSSTASSDKFSDLSCSELLAPPLPKSSSNNNNKPPVQRKSLPKILSITSVHQQSSSSSSSSSGGNMMAPPPPLPAQVPPPVQVPPAQVPPAQVLPAQALQPSALQVIYHSHTDKHFVLDADRISFMVNGIRIDRRFSLFGFQNNGEIFLIDNHPALEPGF